MNNSYAQAYCEILEILKYLPINQINKIPKEIINFFKENKDKNYSFTFNPKEDLNKQNISRETNVIIVSLYKDYFATEIQKEKINKILINNEIDYQNELREKYNPKNLFEDKKVNKNTEQKLESNLTVINSKKTLFEKILDKIKVFLKK